MSAIDLALKDYHRVRELVLTLGRKPMMKCEIAKANDAARDVSQAAAAIKKGDLVLARKALAAAVRKANAVALRQKDRVSSSPRKKP